MGPTDEDSMFQWLKRVGASEGGRELREAESYGTPVSYYNRCLPQSDLKVQPERVWNESEVMWTGLRERAN